MKKLPPLFLSLLLCLSLCPAALAQESTVPGPPPWCPSEEYVAFGDAPVYEPETWAVLQALRDHAAGGGTYQELMTQQPELYEAWRQLLHDSDDPGLGFESGLIAVQYMDNSSYTDKVHSISYTRFQDALDGLEEGTAQYGITAVWYLRSYILTHYASYLTKPFDDDFLSELHPLLSNGAATMEQVYDSPFMDVISQEQRHKLSAALTDYAGRTVPQITLTLDGSHLAWVTDAVGGRTMAPVRLLSETLGADVTWVQESQQAVLSRAGSTVTMTLGDTTAYVDGVPMEMSVAPYAVNGRTYLPVRYVAEFFGQVVTWDPESRTAAITEDKSVAGDSTLEAWALAMGAYDSYILGGRLPPKFGLTQRTKSLVGDARCKLRDSWGITCREDLIVTICYMTSNGHNASFLSEAASGSDGVWRFTKTLYDKWGDRGILCWDLFRMSSLAQRGYVSGYVTYAEALALVEPAARLLQENFSSWREAYENYLDGYNWWRGADGTGEDPWEFGVGFSYTNMMNSQVYAPVFNDGMFIQDIVSVPGVSAEELLAEISGEA